MPEAKPINPERGLPTPEVVAEVFEQASPERKVPVQPPPPLTKLPQPPPPQIPAVAGVPPRVLTPLQQAVENVLADGLGDLYRSLNPAQQQLFKTKGEEATVKISQLLGQVKVKVAEVLRLIRDWLCTIPGLSKYFAEQTAKIKADKLLRLH